MNISRDVINDLLPLYFSDECSQDTGQLVKEYLKSDPNFAEQVKRLQRNPLPDDLPRKPEKEDELKSLLKMRRLLKIRSVLMAFAIFCTLVPFSFIHTGGKLYLLFREAPTSALIYIILGVGFWIAYFMLKRRTNDL